MRARAWLESEWDGPSFLALGPNDPVLGAPAMHALRKVIRNAPEPFVVEGAGHFVQEAGAVVAQEAIEAFG